MASEGSRLLGVQETQVIVIPQQASINLSSDGQPVSAVLTRIVRVTQVRRIVGVQVTQDSEGGCRSCCISMLVLLLGLLLLAVPVTMIVIGSVHFNECPAETHLPIFLLVSGVVFLLLLLSLGCHSEACGPCCICLYGLISLFLMSWSITGAVWVFTLHIVDLHDTQSPDYCNAVVYVSAKVFAVIGCVWAFLICCCSRRNDDD